MKDPATKETAMKYGPTLTAHLIPTLGQSRDKGPQGKGNRGGMKKGQLAGQSSEPIDEATAELQRSELKKVFKNYRWPILLTYFLFNAESLLRLAQPFLIGLAINDLLHSSYQGLIFYGVGHASYMALRLIRQMYDTRTFTRIYADRVSELVKTQRKQKVELSRITARSTLSQEFITFFELGVPMIIRSLYSVVGALVMLLWYDSVLLAICAGLIIPAYFFYKRLQHNSFLMSRELHDQREREVDILAKGTDEEILEHYKILSKHQVRLSDAEAKTVGMMEFFILTVMLVSLVRFCSLESVEPGDIFAVFRYVLMFMMGLDSLPKITQTISKLRDIQSRLFAPKGA